MVIIVKRIKGRETYYYLRHNVRKNNRSKEIYLGKKISANIDEIKHPLETVMAGSRDF
jgi:hypothetical protein